MVQVTLSDFQVFIISSLSRYTWASLLTTLPLESQQSCFEKLKPHEEIR